ncbi:unnamed protein product [Schistocephalus solidus]|uniref:UBZ4-type domain-containing protein n=1 Tax=Schistocephalus solidus TaxID=70667 RepID=A0A183T8J7_SCHSO|nr:unnamed protein product [Schistocephalus solidus]
MSDQSDSHAEDALTARTFWKGLGIAGVGPGAGVFRAAVLALAAAIRLASQIAAPVFTVLLQAGRFRARSSKCAGLIRSCSKGDLQFPCNIVLDPFVERTRGEITIKESFGQSFAIHPPKILKVIQEEVSNFFQKEMQKTLSMPEQPTTSTLTVPKTATPAPNPTPQFPPAGDGPSNPRSTAVSAVSTSEPVDVCSVFEPLLPHADQFVGWPNVVTQPTKPAAPPTTYTPEQPTKPAAPPTAYTPEQETPECPVCNRTCPDRVALELHLERCLASQP